MKSPRFHSKRLGSSSHFHRNSSEAATSSARKTQVCLLARATSRSSRAFAMLLLPLSFSYVVAQSYGEPVPTSPDYALKVGWRLEVLVALRRRRWRVGNDLLK